MELTVFSLLYLFSAVISLSTALFAYRRINAVGAKELILLMLVVTMWSFIVFLESMMTTVSGKILMSKLSYPAVMATPVLFYIFAQRFTGHRRYRKFLDYAPLFLIPIIVLVLAWSNEYHGLIWSGYSGINPKTNLIQYYHGLGYFVGALTYSYVLVALASIELVRFILEEKDLLRIQAWLLLFAAMCPWLASVCYLLELNIAKGFDLIPGFFSISGLIFIVGILNYRFLDLVPIARELLLENVQEGVLVLDINQCVQDINVTAKLYLGIESEVFPGTPIDRINLTVPDLLDGILNQKSYPAYEVDAGAAVKTFKISNISLNTKPLSRLVVLRDITDLVEKQNEVLKTGKEYRKLYNLFRLMADNLPDLLWAKDLNKKYIFVNKATCDTLLQAVDTDEPIGKTRDEFIKRQMELNPENSKRYNIGQYGSDSDDTILETGKVGVFEEFGYVRGKFSYFDIRKAPIIDENGEMVGIVGSARDVTLQKKTEIELIAAKERAEQADRLKSSFLANMSHEVRTPMNSILGFISLMQDGNPSPEEQMEYFSIIKNGGERLTNTINDILELSRIDSGQMQLIVGETNIPELNNILYSMFEPEAKTKMLNLKHVNVESEEVLIVKTDRNKLYSVLSKLIKNAIKYTKQGEIRFGYNYDSGYLSYFVEDTGIGIPVSSHQAIFERFVQVDGSINRNYEGSGLGLSLCKAYVEMMGGSIWLESQVGKGSTFYFRIPLNGFSENRTVNVLSESFKARNRSLRVLIVEDDPGSYEYLKLILKRAGHQVTHTFTGFEAIERCRQPITFDVILMDVKLPGIDGFEATRRIREFNPEITIIAVSAFAFSEDQDQAISAGCNDYITKPVKKELLLSRLNKIQ
jgi:signal transduction histidine kinase